MKLNPKLIKRFFLIYRKAMVVDRLHFIIEWNPDRLIQFKNEEVKALLLDKSGDLFEQLITIHKIQFL